MLSIIRLAVGKYHGIIQIRSEPDIREVMICLNRTNFDRPVVTQFMYPTLPESVRPGRVDDSLAA